MRRFAMAVVLSALFGSAAYGQVYSLEDMIQAGIRQCMAGGESFNYCNCYVRHWVGLWDGNDSYVWRQTGSATPHMQQMESVAAQQCRAMMGR